MRIGVLFGGDSEERDVSIASASQVARALRERGHEIVLVDTAGGGATIAEGDGRGILTERVPEAPPTSGELQRLRASHPPTRIAEAVDGTDVVFLALHGGSGENGQFQAVLELAGVTFTGSGSLGSALAMDKDVSKRLFRAAGIPTPDWLIGPALIGPALNGPVTADEIEQAVGFPAIVKPNAQGSTIGLSLVHRAADVDAALATASAFGDVLIERFVAGRELTVGVLDGQALAVGEIELDPDSTFSYEEKYQQGAVREVFPADVPAAVEAEARRLALAAHRALKLDDYSRADFRLDATGALWLIEVNTVPGLTATSLLPQSAAAVGIDYGALCERICDLALARAARSRGSRG